MGAMKQGKAAPRGPRRKDGATLEPLTIRMSTKLRFGLELLARAQHRSLSQAVEWALNVGLNNHVVSSDDSDTTETIGSVVERAWSYGSASERALVVYRLNPVLLSFEDSKTCELIETSSERLKIHDLESLIVSGGGDVEGKAENELDQMRETYYRFVSVNWDRLRQAAANLAQAGRPTVKLPILRVLGIQHLLGNSDVFATMNTIATCQVAGDPAGALKELASRLANQRPHSEQEIWDEIGLLISPFESSAPPR